MGLWCRLLFGGLFYPPLSLRYIGGIGPEIAYEKLALLVSHRIFLNPIFITKHGCTS